MFCVSLGVSNGHQDVVNVDISKLHSLADVVHQALEGLGRIFSPKSIRKNSKSPNGVMMAVFGTSSAATGI